MHTEVGPHNKLSGSRDYPPELRDPCALHSCEVAMRLTRRGGQGVYCRVRIRTDTQYSVRTTYKHNTAMDSRAPWHF